MTSPRHSKAAAATTRTSSSSANHTLHTPNLCWRSFIQFVFVSGYFAELSALPGSTREYCSVVDQIGQLLSLVSLPLLLCSVCGFILFSCHRFTIIINSACENLIIPFYSPSESTSSSAAPPLLFCSCPPSLIHCTGRGL